MTATTRSSPIPVSTCFAARGLRLPSVCASYWIKTRFHISMTRGLPVFTRSFPGTRSRSASVRRSIWISEQGPHGPVSPIIQKLSSEPKARILSFGIRVSVAQSDWASSSRSSPSPSSPAWTVAYSLSGDSPHWVTKSSQAQEMASFLK